MHLKINGKITIQNAEGPVLNAVKKMLTLDNPQYRMALAMIKNDPSKRKMLYAIPPVFKYYNETDDGLEVGRGLANRLVNYFNAYSIEFTTSIDRVCPCMDNVLPEMIKLRDNQPGVATQILNHKQGIAKLSMGFGKTIIAFRLAEKTQTKTLIVCCKAEATELIKYKHDFKKIYGQEIGVIQGNHFNIKDVTVSTASTLIKRDLSSVKNNFGLVLVDECHVGMSDKRIGKLQELNPERFYGMSGTPGRANGQGDALEFYYGPVIINRKLPQAKPDVHIYKTNTELIGSEYYKMEEAVVDNKKRNVLISKIIYNLSNNGRRILVLTKRIDHGQIIKVFLKAAFGVDSLALSSKDPASMRSELIQALRDESKDFKVLIGTYGLFSTGIDIPLIDTVLLAMSVKVDGEYDATLLQSVGRCLRLHDKKQKPLVIDLDDNLNKIMHRHFGTRLGKYKSEGWNVERMN